MSDREPCERCGQTHDKCTAHRRKRREDGALVPCGANPITGRDVCRLHGGATPRGTASPHYKHGRYSVAAALNKRLRSRFERLAADADLTSMRSAIALTDLRIMDLLERLPADDAPERWKAVRGALDALERALAAGQGASQAFDRLRREIVDGQTAGFATAAIWAEVREEKFLRTKAVEAESRRLKDEQHMVALDRLFLLVDGLAGAVRQHVKDRGTLTAIDAEFLRVTDALGAGALLAAASDAAAN